MTATVALGDAAKIVAGQHIEASLYNDDPDGTPYLTGPADFGDIAPIVTKWTSAPRVFAHSSDVLVTVKGAGVGKSNLGCDAAIGRQLMAVRPIDGHSTQSFLFHFIRYQEKNIARLADGATVPGIGKDDLANLRLPKLPLDEQRRIAAILDKADALRRKRKRALELLDGLTQSIFLEMFGDPVRNEKGLPATTIGALGVEMLYGPRFYNETYSEDGTRIVRITDLDASGELNFDDMPRLSVSREDLKTHQSQPGEILFARTGATVGKMALVMPSDPESIPGAYFIRLRFSRDIDPCFAFHTLRQGSIQKIISEQSRQSAQQNFSGPGLRRLPFFLPSKKDQAQFSKNAGGISNHKASYRTSILEFDHMFASLQHRAFSGQL